MHMLWIHATVCTEVYKLEAIRTGICRLRVTQLEFDLFTYFLVLTG